jgi:hypothetical protein
MSRELWTSWQERDALIPKQDGPPNGFDVDPPFPPSGPVTASTSVPAEVVWDGRTAEQLETPGRRFPEPEDRGHAEPTELASIEYVENLLQPGRILLVAAEEGTGKTYAIDGELGIRLACAGGLFAETWPVRAQVGVLYLSEMHADDDYRYEQDVLAALERQRADLVGRYFRLPLMTAAGGAPALMVAEWRTYITTWMADPARQVRVLVVDTATGATGVDPWGKAIQEVYRNLRLMIADHPELSIVLVVHVKKPSGRGERRISDVLGEWGRWCDVVLMLEADGQMRTKLTTYKRVRTHRRIVATRRGGLLVEAIDADAAKGTKVPLDDVRERIRENPGISYAALASKLGVSKDTAKRYVEALGSEVDSVSGPNRAAMVFLAEAPMT